MMADATIAFSSVSVVTSSLLKRWVRPAHSVMADERRALPEPLWVDTWEALRAAAIW